jgi:hypothetical protein
MVIVTLTDVRSTVPAVRRRRPALDIVQWVVVAIGVIGGLILPLLGVTPVAVVFACGVVSWITANAVLGNTERAQKSPTEDTDPARTRS